MTNLHVVYIKITGRQKVPEHLNVFGEHLTMKYKLRSRDLQKTTTFRKLLIKQVIEFV